MGGGICSISTEKSNTTKESTEYVTALDFDVELTGLLKLTGFNGKGIGRKDEKDGKNMAKERCNQQREWGSGGWREGNGMTRKRGPGQMEGAGWHPPK